MTHKCRDNLHPGSFSRLAAMRQPATFALALALGCAAAFGLAACGGGEDAKLLPGTTAQEISENLAAVNQLAGEGECVGAADEAQEVSTQVEELDEVDPKLKRALEAGAARLNEVVASCEEEEATETVRPAGEATETEEEDLPPGQEKKEEKEREKEEEQLEKEEAKQEEQQQPPTETTPAEPPTTPTPPPPSEKGGGTGAPGGVSPGKPVPPGDE
jgi:outer membrane biosynthesis protein TonB